MPAPFQATIDELMIVRSHVSGRATMVVTLAAMRPCIMAATHAAMMPAERASVCASSTARRAVWLRVWRSLCP